MESGHTTVPYVSSPFHQEIGHTCVRAQGEAMGLALKLSAAMWNLAASAQDLMEHHRDDPRKKIRTALKEGFFLSWSYLNT